MYVCMYVCTYIGAVHSAQHVAKSVAADTSCEGPVFVQSRHATPAHELLGFAGLMTGLTNPKIS